MTLDNHNQGRHKANPDHLYQRGDTWWIRYNVGSDKIRRSLGTTSLREAKRLRDEILAKRTIAARFGLAIPQIVPCKTFQQIAEQWLESRMADESLAPKTRYYNNRMTRTVLIPEFGSLLMNELSAEAIERFISKLYKKPLSRGSVTNCFVCLRTIIRCAIRRGWYEGMNPLDRMERKPTQGPGRDVSLTEGEAARLLAELSGVLYYKVGLALYTGLRWGEVYGLAWIDFALEGDPPLLTVRRSFRGKPKNEASAATVPISQDAVILLRRWRDEQSAQLGYSPLWVFPTLSGRLYVAAPTDERLAIHAASKRADITKHVTPHIFRHTFGTWVYERTGDPKMVQRLMRHASFQTSMRYVHDRRDLGAVVNTLPRLVSHPGLTVM